MNLTKIDNIITKQKKTHKNHRAPLIGYTAHIHKKCTVSLTHTYIEQCKDKSSLNQHRHAAWIITYIQWNAEYFLCVAQNSPRMSEGDAFFHVCLIIHIIPVFVGYEAQKWYIFIYQYTHNSVLGEIIYLFPNSNTGTVEVWERIGNIILQFTGIQHSYEFKVLSEITRSTYASKIGYWDIEHCNIIWKNCWSVICNYGSARVNFSWSMEFYRN